MSRNSCQVILGKGSEGWSIYSSAQVQKLRNCTVVRMAELSLGDLPSNSFEFLVWGIHAFNKYH